TCKVRKGPRRVRFTGNKDKRTTSHDNQSPYLFWARRYNLVGQNPARETAQDTREMPHATVPGRNTHATALGDLRRPHRQGMKQQPALTIQMATEVRQGLQRNVAQGTEWPLVDPDRPVQRGATGSAQEVSQGADALGSDAGQVGSTRQGVESCEVEERL